MLVPQYNIALVTRIDEQEHLVEEKVTSALAESCNIKIASHIFLPSIENKFFCLSRSQPDKWTIVTVSHIESPHVFKSFGMSLVLPP